MLELDQMLSEFHRFPFFNERMKEARKCCQMPKSEGNHDLFTIVRLDFCETIRTKIRPSSKLDQT